ncbi:hypothetical protein SNEBB_000781 [Seison nebaliae]|nr:hypothetical protein SNEBB_000781 [Seison nebaliae]
MEKDDLINDLIQDQLVSVSFLDKFNVNDEEEEQQRQQRQQQQQQQQSQQEQQEQQQSNEQRFSRSNLLKGTFLNLFTSKSLAKHLVGKPSVDISSTNNISATMTTITKRTTMIDDQYNEAETIDADGDDEKNDERSARIVRDDFEMIPAIIYSDVTKQKLREVEEKFVKMFFETETKKNYSSQIFQKYLRKFAWKMLADGSDDDNLCNQQHNHHHHHHHHHQYDKKKASIGSYDVIDDDEIKENNFTQHFIDHRQIVNYYQLLTNYFISKLNETTNFCLYPRNGHSKSARHNDEGRKIIAVINRRNGDWDNVTLLLQLLQKYYHHIIRSVFIIQPVTLYSNFRRQLCFTSFDYSFNIRQYRDIREFVNRLTRNAQEFHQLLQYGDKTLSEWLEQQSAIDRLHVCVGECIGEVNDLCKRFVEIKEEMINNNFHSELNDLIETTETVLSPSTIKTPTAITLTTTNGGATISGVTSNSENMSDTCTTIMNKSSSTLSQILKIKEWMTFIEEQRKIVIDNLNNLDVLSASMLQLLMKLHDDATSPMTPVMSNKNINVNQSSSLHIVQHESSPNDNNIDKYAYTKSWINSLADVDEDNNYQYTEIDRNLNLNLSNTFEHEKLNVFHLQKLNEPKRTIIAADQIKTIQASVIGLEIYVNYLSNDMQRYLHFISSSRQFENSFKSIQRQVDDLKKHISTATSTASSMSIFHRNDLYEKLRENFSELIESIEELANDGIRLIYRCKVPSTDMTFLFESHSHESPYYDPSINSGEVTNDSGITNLNRESYQLNESICSSSNRSPSIDSHPIDQSHQKRRDYRYPRKALNVLRLNMKQEMENDHQISLTEMNSYCLTVMNERYPQFDQQHLVQHKEHLEEHMLMGGKCLVPKVEELDVIAGDLFFHWNLNMINMRISSSIHHCDEWLTQDIMKESMNTTMPISLIDLLNDNRQDLLIDFKSIIYHIKLHQYVAQHYGTKLSNLLSSEHMTENYRLIFSNLDLYNQFNSIHHDSDDDLIDELFIHIWNIVQRFLPNTELESILQTYFGKFKSYFLITDIQRKYLELLNSNFSSNTFLHLYELQLLVLKLNVFWHNFPISTTFTDNQTNDELTTTNIFLGIMTTNNDKRFHAIKEILDTERTYINELQSVVEDYEKQIADCQSPEIIENMYLLFSNVKQIYLFHSTVFLPVLRLASFIPGLIAHTFIFYKEELYELYLHYLLNHKLADSFWRTYCESNSYFPHTRKRIGKLFSLSHVLVQPIQRIGKYQLLLKSIVENTKNENEKAILLDASLTIHEIVKAIDSAQMIYSLYSNNKESHNNNEFKKNMKELGRLYYFGDVNLMKYRTRDNHKDHVSFFDYMTTKSYYGDMLFNNDFRSKMTNHPTFRQSLPLTINDDCLNENSSKSLNDFRESLYRTALNAPSLQMSKKDKSKTLFKHSNIRKKSSFRRFSQKSIYLNISMDEKEELANLKFFDNLTCDDKGLKKLFLFDNQLLITKPLKKHKSSGSAIIYNDYVYRINQLKKESEPNHGMEIDELLKNHSIKDNKWSSLIRHLSPREVWAVSGTGESVHMRDLVNFVKSLNMDNSLINIFKSNSNIVFDNVKTLKNVDPEIIHLLLQLIDNQQQQLNYQKSKEIISPIPSQMTSPPILSPSNIAACTSANNFFNAFNAASSETGENGSNRSSINSTNSTLVGQRTSSNSVQSISFDMGNNNNNKRFNQKYEIVSFVDMREIFMRETNKRDHIEFTTIPILKSCKDSTCCLNSVHFFQIQILPNESSFMHIWNDLLSMNIEKNAINLYQQNMLTKQLQSLKVNTPQNDNNNNNNNNNNIRMRRCSEKVVGNDDLFLNYLKNISSTNSLLILQGEERCVDKRVKEEEEEMKVFDEKVDENQFNSPRYKPITKKQGKFNLSYSTSSQNSLYE